MAQSSQVVLRVEDLHVAYGNIQAVRGVSIEVRQGELVALIGANGAGKSTLLRAILGLHQGYKGKLVFLGQDVTALPPEKRVSAGICLVPEGRGILAPLTVKDNLGLGAYPRSDFMQVSQDLNKMMGEHFPILGQRRGQKAGTLSGGEQQMLAIARGLMAAPKLMMLDEPSLGLAPLIVNQMFQIIADLKARGITILLSEQNARKALQAADRAYVLETGTLVLQGNARELANDERVKRTYLGGDTCSR
ncbi:MAG: ABC transporter ATP-binding protein [Chloroflexota bacterium]